MEHDAPFSSHPVSLTPKTAPQRYCSSLSRISGFSKERLLPFLILLLCGVGLGIFLGLWTHGISAEARELKFQTQSASIASLVDARWRGFVSSTRALAVNVAHLQSLSGLTRSRFKSIAQVIRETYPARAYEYAPRVVHAEREQFVADSSAYWNAQLNISTPNNTFFFRGLQYDGEDQLDTTIVREPAAEYLPVSFIEPVQGNAKAINFDLLSRRGTAALLGKALAWNDAVASFRIELVQDSLEHSFGVIIFGPVPNATDFVLSVVSVQELLHSAAQSAELGSEMYLYDATGNDFFVFLGAVQKTSTGDLRMLPQRSLKKVRESHGLYAEFGLMVTDREYLLVTSVDGEQVFANDFTSTLLAVVVVSLFSSRWTALLGGQFEPCSEDAGQGECGGEGSAVERAHSGGEVHQRVPVA